MRGKPGPSVKIAMIVERLAMARETMSDGGALMRNTVLVTGSAGLIGSETARFFHAKGYRVVGIDNDMRKVFFGADASTDWNRCLLEEQLKSYRHHAIDIRDRTRSNRSLPNTAATSAWSCTPPRSRRTTGPRASPFTDFDVNAVGTLNAAGGGPRSTRPRRRSSSRSTNKVYGDTPNALPLRRAGDPVGDRARRTPYAARHRRGHVDRQSPAQRVRRVEGRGRRDGAGVRPLLRHEDRPASAAAP